MPKAPAAIHIRSETYPERALCGASWATHHGGLRGGRIASDTSPPVVSDDERGSANAVTCRTCLAVWRRMRRAQA
jgi:hypothetical protein